MADSCSHWWHAPCYLAMSVILAFIAFASMKHSRPEIPTPPFHGLALNASRILRRHGNFHITATLLQISPDLFFSGLESTVFAIQDSAISNLSIPASDFRQLLRYHTAASSLPMVALAKKPPGSCLATLVESKKLVITEKDPKTGSVTINNMLISDPDLFLQGPLTVHGVRRPFDAIASPSCEFSDLGNSRISNSTDRGVEWTRMIRVLSSKGFVSFAIALNAVLDGILQDFKNLNSCTIFAPPNSAFISPTTPFLDRIVRLHIVPRRFSIKELAGAEQSSLRTLVPGYNLKIHRFSGSLIINGAEITSSGIFSNDKFVIHGISTDFVSKDGLMA